MNKYKRKTSASLPRTCIPILSIVTCSFIATVVMTVYCSALPQILEQLVQLLDDKAETITSDVGGSIDSSITRNLAQLESKTAVITADEELTYPQVFFRGNTADCGLHFDFNHDGEGISSNSTPKAHEALAVTEWSRLPMYADGAAAGPLVDCTPSMVMSNKCDVKKKFHELEVVKSLRKGRAFQFFLPVQPPEKSNAVVVSRARMSSSTGVVFLDANHIAVASYGMKKVYLYEYHLQTSDMEKSYARLLDSVDATGNPDLMDVDLERKLLVVSHLKAGSQFLFEYDLEKGALSQYKEVEAFGPTIQDQWCHEAAFYPFTTSSVIAASSSRAVIQDTLMVSLFDYERDVVIAQYMMQSHDLTEGYKAQGIRFIDKRHFIADITRQHVDAYRKGKMCQKIKIPKDDDKQNRMALFRLNFSVDDIVSGKIDKPMSSEDFTVMDVYDMGVGAFDGISYHEGTAIVADQLNDRVVVFKVDVNADKPISFVVEHRGYVMPHGVSISTIKNHIAVTAYGDNSVIVHPFLGTQEVQNVVEIMAESEWFGACHNSKDFISQATMSILLEHANICFSTLPVRRLCLHVAISEFGTTISRNSFLFAVQSRSLTGLTLLDIFIRVSMLRSFATLAWKLPSGISSTRCSQCSLAAAKYSLSSSLKSTIKKCLGRLFLSSEKTSHDSALGPEIPISII